VALEDLEWLRWDLDDPALLFIAVVIPRDWWKNCLRE
jgi:hypothetical protein